MSEESETLASQNMIVSDFSATLRLTDYGRFARHSSGTPRNRRKNLLVSPGGRVAVRSVREEARMTDPSDGLKSFQRELRRGSIAIQVTKTDPNLFVLPMDHPSIGSPTSG